MGWSRRSRRMRSGTDATSRVSSPPNEAQSTFRKESGRAGPGHVEAAHQGRGRTPLGRWPKDLATLRTIPLIAPSQPRNRTETPRHGPPGPASDYVTRGYRALTPQCRNWGHSTGATSALPRPSRVPMQVRGKSSRPAVRANGQECPDPESSARLLSDHSVSRCDRLDHP